METDQVETVFKDCMPEENEDGEILYSRKFHFRFYTNLINHFYYYICKCYMFNQIIGDSLVKLIK